MMLFTENEETKENESTQAEGSAAVEASGPSEIDKLHEDYRRFGIEGGDEESMDSIADILSTFQSEGEEGEKKDDKAGKKSDLSKKKFLIPILTACAVVGLILYYAVLLPMLKTADPTKEIPPINTWLDQQVENGAMSDAERTALLSTGKCEVLGSQNRILMFNHVEKANIQSVEVHNTHGTYTFYRDSSDNFAILGAETTSYSKEMLSSLVVSSGYTLSMTRVSEICEDMHEYGLAPEDEPSYYTLTTTSGVTHTVYIGSPIPTGAGYYCSYEDRPAVYVLDSTLASTLLADVKDLMTAILTYAVSSTNYYTITNFEMTKNGERFLEVNYLTDAERVQTASTSVWRMVYPEGGYTPSSSGYDGMLQTFSSFIGNRVLEYNVLKLDEDEISDEEIAVLDKYGLAQPETTVSFDYTDPDQGYTVTNSLWFSKMTEEGTYYVYSWLFNLISEIDAANYPWIGYDILDFIDKPVFQMNINNVGKVEIYAGPAADADTQVQADYRLNGEGQALIVTEDKSGKTLDTQNYRQLYKTMLSINIEGYTEDDSTEESTLFATLKVTTKSDVVTEYKFYSYSTRRCFMTINGEGEFYVMRDQVRKMLSDAQKVIDGVAVSSDARS
ncbi:MAG: DUF4340 domain-containing protein [Clostridia bacterium]|nr:DUF4340 domain-containing protein [Clostridia bacterium]